MLRNTRAYALVTGKLCREIIGKLSSEINGKLWSEISNQSSSVYVAITFTFVNKHKTEKNNLSVNASVDSLSCLKIAVQFQDRKQCNSWKTFASGAAPLLVTYDIFQLLSLLVV